MYSLAINTPSRTFYHSSTEGHCGVTLNPTLATPYATRRAAFAAAMYLDAARLLPRYAEVEIVPAVSDCPAVSL